MTNNRQIIDKWRPKKRETNTDVYIDVTSTDVENVELVYVYICDLHRVVIFAMHVHTDILKIVVNIVKRNVDMINVNLNVKTAVLDIVDTVNVNIDVKSAIEK